jgi:hypothetical protein
MELTDQQRERQAMLKGRFEQFAVYEGELSSPLYARLARSIAADPELLALAAEARSTPVPNLLLGAVHYLLLKGATHPLAAFYPSLTDRPRTDADPYPVFQAFCREHQDAIRDLLRTRRVQTNEVRRCACLLPAFAYVARLAPDRPLALLEIGPSAGLNLLWDRYGYDYGTGGQYGDPQSPVQLRCTLRGARRPPLPITLPPVAWRAGLDLNPVDVRDPDAVLWLRALIWPEHHERAALLAAALPLVQQDPPPLIAGDALDLLPAILPTVPAEATLCIFHSFTLNQFPHAARERFLAILAEHSRRRDIYRVFIEGLPGLNYPQMGCTTFAHGVAAEQALGICNAHGEWLEWRL